MDDHVDPRAVARQVLVHRVVDHLVREVMLPAVGSSDVHPGPLASPFEPQGQLRAITRPREVITVDGVIKAVASYDGLKPSDIKSERRHKSVATPRAVAMYIPRHHTKDSYPDLREVWRATGCDGAAVTSRRRQRALDAGRPRGRCGVRAIERARWRRSGIVWGEELPC